VLLNIKQEVGRRGAGALTEALMNLTQPRNHLLISKVKVKVKVSRNGPGVAQRVPGGLGYQISVIFGT
jgi:hypothetical protein